MTTDTTESVGNLEHSDTQPASPAPEPPRSQQPPPQASTRRAPRLAALRRLGHMLRPRLRYIAAAVPLSSAAALYGVVLRDELTYQYCDQYSCEPFGSYYPQAWLMFGLAAGASAVLFKARSILLRLELILRLILRPRSGARISGIAGLSLPGRAAVGATLIAAALVLVAMATQRVIRPEDTEKFTTVAFFGAGLAIYGATGVCLIGICQPRLLERPLPGLNILRRAAHRDVLSVAVVSATFVLTIYSSEVWTGMLATPWYTVALICLILVGAAIAMAGHSQQPPQTVVRDQVIRRRQIAGRSRRTSTANGTPTPKPRHAWASPVAVATVSFLGFFVLAVDLLAPAAVQAVVDSTSDCGYPGCADVSYPSMVAKIAALLAALTTVVAAESKNSHRSAG